MKIVFATTDDIDSSEWIDPLQAAIPGAQFYRWDENGSSVGAELAVARRPPVNLFVREPGIRAIFNLAAGVDALLNLPGLTDDVAMFRLEDAGMSAQMAEYAAYAVIRASRQLGRYEALQGEARWQQLPPIRRSRWPVGVLGMGVMGARVAQTLAALDYPVAGWSRSGKQLPGIDAFAGNEQLPAFLARTRVLINTLPLTDATRNILCRETLTQLLPGAHLVNVGRGEHLVEEDLLALLDSGHIAGATLDVFRQEPLPADHPFWHHPGVTITPHVSAATLRDETLAQIAEKINCFMRGEPVSGAVVRGRGY